MWSRWCDISQGLKSQVLLEVAGLLWGDLKDIDLEARLQRMIFFMSEIAWEMEEFQNEGTEKIQKTHLKRTILEGKQWTWGTGTPLFLRQIRHEIPLSSNFISDVLKCHFKLKLTVTVSHASMEVAAMDVVDSYPLQIRYDMQYSELLRLTMVYIAICSIGQILAIPVSWLLFPRSRTQEARGEPGGDLWAADAICLLLFSIALFLGLGGLGLANGWVWTYLRDFCEKLQRYPSALFYRS